MVDQRGDSLVLEEFESPITGSLVKVCSRAATRGAGRRGGDGEVAEAWRQLGGDGRGSGDAVKTGDGVGGLPAAAAPR